MWGSYPTKGCVACVSDEVMWSSYPTKECDVYVSD